jgi:hypothetical protein
VPLTSTKAEPHFEAVSPPSPGFGRLLTAAVAYLLASLYATWPLPRGATDHLVSHYSAEDILLHTWGLAWDVHALAHHPLTLFDANILHPARNTLALSEHLLGQVPLYGPVWLATGNPVLAMNANIFLTFVLTAMFTHFVVWRWTGSSIAALVAGFAFAFAPWRLEQFQWPQLLSVQYFPLVLYALDRTGSSGRLGWGLAAGAVLTLQTLCSYYLGYMAMLLAALYVPADMLVRGMRRRARAVGALAVALLLPVAVMLPLSLPYLEARKASEFVWLENVPKADLAAFQAMQGSLSTMVTFFVGRGPAWLALLAVVPLAVVIRRGDRDGATRLVALLLVAVAAFGTAAGPLGQASWFAPYAWLSAIVPGFSTVRLPSRFGFLLSFCASMLAGLGVASVLRSSARYIERAPLRTAATSLVAAAALAAAATPLWWRRPPRPIAIPTGAHVPAAYRWLARNGEGSPLLELPVSGPKISTWTKAGMAEAMAMYFSTYHWLPILNGYSGYIPDSYPALMEHAARLPDPGALRVLVDCAGLRWILLRDADPGTRAAWQRPAGVKLRGEFARVGSPDDLLYEVEWRPVAPCPLDAVPS